MSSSKNIKNALAVMYKTYENIDKLINFCKAVAGEKTDYINPTEKLLRRKSDVLNSYWLINDFILLFQNKNDEECESGNGWLNGCIYVMEICIGEKDKDDLPTVYLSKFDYKDINSISGGRSPADYWVYYWPIRRADLMNITNENGYRISKPKNDKNSKTYSGVKKVTTSEFPLTDLTAENVQEKIFDEFDRLSKVY